MAMRSHNHKSDQKKHRPIPVAAVFVCLFTITVFFGHVPPGKALEIMLPQVYQEGLDISGWLMSEKLDGVRGYWDGEKLLSKNGNPFKPPPEVLENLPPFALEGEIWGGRGTFESTMSIVGKENPHPGWLTLKFAIFDVPEVKGSFTARIEKAESWFVAHPGAYAFVIPQKQVQGKEELEKELQRVQALGGEGLMVRNPDAFYGKGRSGDILKVKSYDDTEARVIAHLPGKGRNKGRMGSLLVELPTGIQFKIGTGFTDKQRENPPPVGSIITFKYYGFYDSGIPKFPSFMRVRYKNSSSRSNGSKGSSGLKNGSNK